uniref:EamA domain-containing protein n=1 Tax=Haptolina brevifila TaxID=156173 RepID=A0A6U7P2G0_9EUKA|mmetsp:Transcript_9335/g.19084  ORF Transcript_9335/g.19084 Transcript_9335/m.19084 type:complete len:535 (+) Transcript_9335:49-1653(+)
MCASPKGAGTRLVHRPGRVYGAPVPPPPCRAPRSRVATAIGCVLVLGVVLLWACELKLLQHLAHQGTWAKPFCQGFLLKSVWVLGMPVMLLVLRCRSGSPQVPAAAAPLQLTLRTVLACGVLTLLVQISSVTWITSIPLTSASANSAIYQSSCALVYVFSIPILREHFSCAKVCAVLLAFAGVMTVITATSDGANDAGGGANVEGRAVFGGMLVFASAATYALKEVMYKRLLSCGRSSPSPVIDAGLCVALIGAWTAVTSPLWLYILDASGVEAFELPPPPLRSGYMLVALFMGLYQVLLFAAIALTSPMFVAVGQLLVSPVSMLWDLIELHYRLPFVGVLGTVAIMVALLLVLLASDLDALLLSLCCRTEDRLAQKVRGCCHALGCPLPSAERMSAEDWSVEDGCGAHDAPLHGRGSQWGSTPRHDGSSTPPCHATEPPQATVLCLDAYHRGAQPPCKEQDGDTREIDSSTSGMVRVDSTLAATGETMMGESGSFSSGSSGSLPWPSPLAPRRDTSYLAYLSGASSGSSKALL